MTRPTVFVYTATLVPRDAVSDQVVRHTAVLQGMGFDAVLVADGTHEFFNHPVIDMAEALARPEPAGWVAHFGVWSRGIEQLVETARGPRVFVYHNTTPPELLPEGPIRTVCREAQERLPEISEGWAGIIGDSGHNLEVLKASGFPTGETIPPLIPGGISDTKGERRRDVMTIGRISPSKGLDRAVKAIGILKQVHDLDVPLHIVGSDSGWDAYSVGLRRLAERTGAKVDFTGSLSDPKRDDLYAEVGALVVTSRHEGFCVPLVEAMRAGTPIVAVDVGAISETLDGGGVLLPTAAPELVAEAVAAVLQDAELGRALSDRARTRAEAFDVDTVAGALKNAFAMAFGAAHEDAA